MARDQAQQASQANPYHGKDLRPATVVHHDMRMAPGYVHAVHPERPGDGVLTYTPGQLMPDWLLGLLAAGGRLVPEAEGVFRLEPKGGKK